MTLDENGKVGIGTTSPSDLLTVSNSGNAAVLIDNQLDTQMNNETIDKAIKHIFKLISLANIYVDKVAPWKLKNTDIDRMNTVLTVLLEIIRRLAYMTYPIMPNKSKNILDILNCNNKKISFDDFNSLEIKKFSINKPEVLFPRYEK